MPAAPTAVALAPSSASSSAPDPAPGSLAPGSLAPDPAPGSLAPGQVSVERDRVLVGTATAPVELGEVGPAGRKAMRALDWARGARLDASERLG